MGFVVHRRGVGAMHNLCNESEYLSNSSLWLPTQLLQVGGGIGGVSDYMLQERCAWLRCLL